MAEGNANRPAPETLTTEDVDRLSERFKPSWESDPQAAPRAEPARPVLKQTMLGGTAPAAPLAPARTAAPAPAAPAPAAPAAAPVAAAPVAAAPVAGAPLSATPVVAKPMATVSVGKSGLEVVRAVRHPTLVGIAPQAIRQVSGAPKAAPDDLDWELPAGEQPEPASDMAQTARIVKGPAAAPPPKAEASRIQPVQAEPPPTAPAAAPAPAVAPDEPLPIDVEELPPKSQPSGIGEKYVPRDQNAPAVVLNDDVQRLEAQTRATMEAQHRARSAPTIARMPAVRVATHASAADVLDEDTVSHRRPRRRGVWVVLGLLTLGSGAVAAVTLLGKPEAPPAATIAPVEKPVAAPDTVAPPPPAVTAEPSPPLPVASVAPASAEAASDVPPGRPQPAKVAAVAPPVETPVETPKRAPTPAARPAKPKPASTTKSSTGSAPRPSRPSVIVRDNPF